MTWILIALLGHLSNSVAFLIDKILLKNAFKRSATYAGLVGLLSGLVIFLIPWITVWPTGVDLLWGILSGLTFMAALWAFFTALSEGEATRVVPIISASIPIITLLGAATLLGERLNINEMIGFGLLILATILLASGKAQSKLTRSALFFSLLSALLFAIASVSGKAVYEGSSFLGGFVTTRIAALFMAIILAWLIDPLSGEEIISIFKPAHNKNAKKGETITVRMAAKLAIFGQIMGGLGFIAVQYATSLGSASIVNALQVIQFALLVVVAFILKSKAQTLLGESINKSVVLIKTIALVIMAIGLYLIVL